MRIGDLGQERRRCAPGLLRGRTVENKPNVRAAIWPLVLITALFFLWALANNLNDVLIGHFKKVFTLNDFQSGLVQSAFYMGYFLLALPAAFFMRRFGYKAAVVLGLLLYGGGALLFYPAAATLSYAFFLVALFVIASGLAFLETAANPLVTVLGKPETAARRLNFAQSFNSLGAVIAAGVGTNFIMTGVEHTPEEIQAMAPAARDAFFAAEAHSAQGPYLVLGGLVLLWALFVALAKFPAVAVEHAASEESPAGGGDFGRLLRNRTYVFGVIAQFFYVGAQVGIWSYLIRYARQADPTMGEKEAGAFLFYTLVLFGVGRFGGTALMGRVSPDRLMGVFAGCNIVLCLIGVFVGGTTGLYAMTATSLFMSIMFPTIFASSLKGIGSATKLGSSFLVMAIIGGAVLTPIMGQISVSTGHIANAMVVPAACFLVIAAFAFRRKVA